MDQALDTPVLSSVLSHVPGGGVGLTAMSSSHEPSEAGLRSSDGTI